MIARSRLRTSVRIAFTHPCTGLGRLVNERRKESVLVRHFALQTVVAKPHLLGFGDDRRKAWNRGKGMARDGHITAILPRQTLNLHLSDTSEAQTSPFSYGTIFDLNCLDAQDFANERGKTRQMSACLSGKDLGQSVLLTLICSLVQIQSDFPFNLHHVAG